MRFRAPKTAFAVGVVFALTLAISGCGGGSSDEAAAEHVPRLSKAELLKKGAAICGHGNSVITTAFNRLAKVDAAAGKVATQNELNGRAARVVLPVRRTELRGLRALGMPDEGARQFRTMLAAMKEGVQKGERDHSLLLAVKAKYAFREASEVGIRFGLTSCWLE
jgi:hypothetical protein